MQIKNLFKKNIDRKIEAVIQAEQHSEEIRFTELDEFVLTEEGETQLKVFYQNYINTLTKPSQNTSVWISGFFGSGKSHYMKIISYLLDNQRVTLNEISKTPIDFLKEKTTDQELIELMTKASTIHNQTVTFNISAQSSTRQGSKLGIAEILYNQFNVMIGLSKYSRIARGEHLLMAEEKYEEFKNQYSQIAGKSWEDSRERVLLNASKVNKALAAIGYTDTDGRILFNSELDLTVDDIASLIANYARSQHEGYRLVFLIDEISQYIGNDSKLILELQTIVERLGSIGLGYVWVVVTSQKSLNDVTKNGQEDDYSKIQARFETRISLTSSNTDEVIKKRLLQKTPEAEIELRELYRKQRDLLQTTLSFKPGTTRLPNGYKDEDQFVSMYPLVPYEIPMLQRIFEKIRDLGEGGSSTSQGERTIIAAAQQAILQDKNEMIGNLVTLAEFYPSIEQQLDPIIVNTMVQARDLEREGKLQAMDLGVLHILYFLRGLENTTLTAEIDNLAVALIPDVQGSLSRTTEAVEESLQRLTKHLFVSKKINNMYEFLTSDERKANDEIRRITVDENSVEQLIQNKLFSEIIPLTTRQVTLGGRTTRFEANYNNHREGKQEYLRINVETRDNALVSGDERTVRIRIHDASYDSVYELFRRKIQRDMYVRTAKANQGAEYNNAVVEKKKIEASEYEREAVERLTEAVKVADFFVNDERQTTTGSIEGRLQDAYKTLITKTYTKMNLVDSLPFKTYREQWIKLANNDWDELTDFSLSARHDMSTFISAKLKTEVVTVEAMVERYTVAPYGWEERDVIAVLLALYGDQTIKFKYQGQALNHGSDRLFELMDKRSERNKILIELVSVLNTEALNLFKIKIRRAFDYNEDVSGDTVEALVQQVNELIGNNFESKLKDIEIKMSALKTKPGNSDLQNALEVIAEYKRQSSEEAKFDWFNKYGAEKFEEVGEILDDLSQFYSSKQYKEYQELIAFQQIHQSEIERALIENSQMKSTAQQFKQLMNQNQLPGNKISKMENLRNELEAFWKEKVEKERAQAIVVIRQSKQKINDLIVKTEEEKEVIKRAKEVLQNLEEQVSNARERAVLDSLLNKIHDVFPRVQNELNSLLQKTIEDDTETKVVTYHAKEAMNALFKQSNKLETVEDIETAVLQLKEDLLKKLNQGTILRQH